MPTLDEIRHYAKEALRSADKPIVTLAILHVEAMKHEPSEERDALAREIRAWAEACDIANIICGE
jgi:hypothetical protein